MSGSVRASASVVLVLGAAAMITGYYPHGAWVTGGSGAHFEYAGGHAFALYLSLLLLPGVAVLHRPNRQRILTWLAWGVPCVAALLSLSIGAEPLWHAHDGRAVPLWPAWLMYALVAAVVCGVVLVVPALGLGHRRSNLPAARIHRA